MAICALIIGIVALVLTAIIFVNHDARIEFLENRKEHTNEKIIKIVKDTLAKTSNCKKKKEKK